MYPGGHSAAPAARARREVAERERAGVEPREHSKMSRLATPIRKNDNVVVTTGKDRGKRGRVLKVLPEKNRVVIEGVNFIKRHTKPNPQRNIKGGLVEREAALHASNVQLVCPECGKPTRLGRRVLGDGRKVRICRKCEGVVDK
jgi:large subunit ribosomal protein L24